MTRSQAVGLCILYVISPIDIAPEIILGPIGLFDDAIVILMGIRKALHG